MVLGAVSDASRAAESQKLLNWGFQAYDTVQLYQSGKPVSALRVWKGAVPEVDAGFLADRYVTLPQGRAGDLKLTLEAMEPLVAPVASGQRVGMVKVGARRQAGGRISADRARRRARRPTCSAARGTACGCGSSDAPPSAPRKDDR